MKKRFLFIVLANMLLLFYSGTKVIAQCSYDNTMNSTWGAPVNIGDSVSTDCIFGGEFMRVTDMQAGEVYKFSTCGLNSFDTQITIYQSGGSGDALAYNDNANYSIQSEVVFTPETTGDYDILVDEYYCGPANEICAYLSVKKVDCPPVNNAYTLFNPNPSCPGSIQLYAYPYGAESYLWTINGESFTDDYYVYHTFSSIGDYPIEITVSNTCGSETTLYDTVHIVNDIPVSNASIYIHPNNTCPGSIYMSASSSNIESCSWTFDGETSNGNYLYHTFDDIGDFPIEVAITNTCGYDTTVYDTVHIVNNIAVTNAYMNIYPDVYACPGNELGFYVSSNSYESCIWLFDGQTFTDNDFHYEFSSVGEYPIEVTVTNSCGNDTTLYDTVYVVNNIPVNDAYLDIPIHQACPGSNIRLSANATYAESYLWSFDGETSSDRYFYHTFSDAGDYPVELTITNSCGNDTTLYDTIYIENDLPVSNANIHIYPEIYACPGSKLELNVSAYSFESCLWSYDGETSTDRYLYHTFDSVGDYPIEVTVTNLCGSDTTLYDTVRIINNIPIYYANLSIYPNQVCPESRIQLNVYANNIQSYLWSYDGETSTSSYVNHTFSSIGDYPIEVTLTNGCGNDTTLYDTVHIEGDLPITNSHLWLYPNPVCPGDDVLFEASSSGITSFAWTYPGGVSNEEMFSQSFTASGEYPISLTLTNGCGNDTIIYDTVYVETNLIPLSGDYDYGIALEEVCPNDDVIFYIFPSGSGDYSFDWGDGSTSTSTNILDLGEEIYDIAQHTYSTTGMYDVTFTLTNGCGNSFTDVGVVEVNSDIEVEGEFFWEDNECANESIMFYALGASNYVWNFGDGTSPINTNQTISSVPHTFASPGTYDISVEISNSCGNTETITEQIVIVDCGLDIEDNILDNGMHVSIYPNPNNGKFNIEIESGLQEDIYMEIINVNGELITSKTYKKSTEGLTDQIDLSMISKGIYFVKIRNDKSVKVSKIILQ